MAELEKLYCTDSKVEAVKKINAIIENGGGGSGFSLFDIVQKDHVLSFEESEGLAMLGSYVYKNGVAGSRYGYADFYEKCLEEYKNSTSSKVYLKSNVNYVGSVKDDKGVLSGFTSTTAYTTIPVKTPTKSFELVVKTQTPSSFSKHSIVQTGTQYTGLIFRAMSETSTCVWLSSNGKSWDVCQQFETNLDIPTNSTVWFKISWDGATYSFAMSTDGNTWTQGATKASTNPIYWANGTQGLGGCSWESYPWANGSIDLNESYLNIDGERYWNGVDSLNYSKNSSGHQFYDIANKAGADFLFEKCGTAWFYGVDEENERIFLPRKKVNNHGELLESYQEGKSWYRIYSDGWCEQGGYAESSNQTVSITLLVPYKDMDYSPIAISNISGSAVNFNSSVSGLTTTGFKFNSQVDKACKCFWQASGYIKAPQQQEETEFLYMVVGNVNVDKAQTDVTEITTSENDTLPLLHNFYSKEDMTTTGAYINASEGGWHSGNVYLTAYNELVNNLGTGNFKSITDEYTDYDFVVNQDNMTFRLPLLNGNEDLPDNTHLVDMTNKAGQDIIVEKNGYFVVVAQTTGSNGFVTISSNYLGVTTSRSVADSSMRTMTPLCKKGDICRITIGSAKVTALNFYPATGNGSLYYKVANAVTNLELLDVAKIESTKADKTAVDGQWVGTNVQLASGVNSAGTSDLIYDLSPYIPNDSYNYEVMLQGKVTTGSTSGNYGALYLKSSLMLETITVCIARTRTSSTMSTGGTVNIPIGIDRLVYVTRESSFNSTFNLDLKCIRRLGTNQ